MGRAAYSKRTCRCGKEVSSAGAAYHSHMMAHVRRGDATVSQPYTFLPLDDPMYNRYVFQWIKPIQIEPAKN